MKQIRGKQAVVTGAASGIGRALALRLATEGVNLFLLDVDEIGLNEVVSETISLGVETVGYQCDLARSEQINNAATVIEQRWGGTDLLVNCAGVCWYGPTQKITDDAWTRVLDINLHAPVQLTRRLLPLMLKRPVSHVLNMASICGLVAGGRYAAYTVSKFGLVGFGDALRAEFNRSGLGVTTVCPGPVDTALFDKTPCGHPHRKTPRPSRWICTTAERVAAKSVRGIFRNKRLVLVNPLAYILHYTQRFAPWLWDGLQSFGRRRSLKRKAVITPEQQRKAA
ncbi:MAG: SDR family oxidoreductase [Planctomycetaceae bacterium]